MAETIGKIVLCYDVSGKHNQVKDALKELGYYDTWKRISTNTLFEMPDTTVWHTRKTVSGATKDIQKICLDLNVTLEKTFSALMADEVDGYND